MEQFWKKAQELNENGKSFVVVTLINVRGSSPQDPGAKIIVTRENKLEWGTVGGGKIEYKCINHSYSILEKNNVNPPEIQTWNLQKDIGMSCGGEVTFLFEHFHVVNWPIVIFGAGHIAQALTRILSPLPCQLVCIDSREEWIVKLEKSETNRIKNICHPSPKELVSTLNSKSFFLCMTMGHSHDVPILFEIYKHHPECPYVGVIGSEIKGKKIKLELRELGVNEDFLKKLKVPMGIELGTNHPQEIAISIASELILKRDEMKSILPNY